MFVMDGVFVMVGVSVIVGDNVMVGVSVMVGVKVTVGEGGNILYMTGSAYWFNANAAHPRNNATRIKRQPRTIKSRRLRK